MSKELLRQAAELRMKLEAYAAALDDAVNLEPAQMGELLGYTENMGHVLGGVCDSLRDTAAIYEAESPAMARASEALMHAAGTARATAALVEAGGEHVRAYLDLGPGLGRMLEEG